MTATVGRGGLTDPTHPHDIRADVQRNRQLAIVGVTATLRVRQSDMPFRGSEMEVQPTKSPHVMAWLVAFAVLVSMAVATVPVLAECIGSTVASQKRAATHVFEATVTSIKTLDHGEYAAALDVHRIWKGKAAPETTVYFFSSIDGPVLKDGEHYIFFTRPLDPVVRKTYGFPPDHPERSHWVPPCSGLARAVDSVFEQLGRSRKPDWSTASGTSSRPVMP